MTTTESQPDSLDPELPEISPSSAPVVDLEFSTPEKPVVAPRPWGPWATIGWTMIWIVVVAIAQILGVMTFAVFRILTSRGAKLDDLATNGTALLVGNLFTTLATLGLVALLVLVRRYPIRDYLALYWPPARLVLIWSAVLAALLVATDLTSYLLGRPLVPEVVVGVYRTTWLPGLLFAFVVLAPVGEETLFRGFLYTGIAASRAGPNVAILISAVIFALIHALQYDWYGVCSVGALGLFLGVVRKQSQSLFLAMFFHAVANAVGTLEVIIQESWLK